jgi:hypothetical protein
MTSTLPTLESTGRPDGRPRAARKAASAASRMEVLTQLAAALHAAVEHWTEDRPEDIWRRARELDGLRSQLAAAPPDMPARSEESTAALLSALAATAKEVRQINEVYMTLLRESQRVIGLRLRHLSAYAPVYAEDASPEPLLWSTATREVRA